MWKNIERNKKVLRHTKQSSRLAVFVCCTCWRMSKSLFLWSLKNWLQVDFYDRQIIDKMELNVEWKSTHFWGPTIYAILIPPLEDFEMIWAAYHVNTYKFLSNSPLRSVRLSLSRSERRQLLSNVSILECHKKKWNSNIGFPNRTPNSWVYQEQYFFRKSVTFHCFFITSKLISHPSVHISQSQSCATFFFLSLIKTQLN